MPDSQEQRKTGCAAVPEYDPAICADCPDQDDCKRAASADTSATTEQAAETLTKNAQAETAPEPLTATSAAPAQAGIDDYKTPAIETTDTMQPPQAQTPISTPIDVNVSHIPTPANVSHIDPPAPIEPSEGSQPLENQMHERFAQNYAKTPIVTRAYENAGYEATGDSAYTCGYRLLGNVRIRKRITYLNALAFDAIGVTHDDTIRRLAEIAQQKYTRKTKNEDGQDIEEVHIGIQNNTIRALAALDTAQRGVQALEKGTGPALNLNIDPDKLTEQGAANLAALYESIVHPPRK
jgi:phage terminase small subunit